MSVKQKQNLHYKSQRGTILVRQIKEADRKIDFAAPAHSPRNTGQAL